MTGDEETSKVEGLEGRKSSDTTPEGVEPGMTVSREEESTDTTVVIDAEASGDNAPEADAGTGQKGEEEGSGPPEAERPVAVLPPIYDYGSDMVVAPQEMSLPTRAAMIEQLISKHRSMVETFTKEREDLERADQEPVAEVEEEKGLRDTVNELVQKLKGERRGLRERNRALSKELFGIFEKQDMLKDRSQEIAMHQSYIDQLEWKIETEDIKIEQERKHLDEIKATMRKLREITDGYTPDEIRQRAQEIQEEIDQNLLMMEEAHRTMLERVEESNKHHGRFMDAQKRAREREARKAWLTRRVELHTEMGKFWEGQIENAVKMDSDDSSRTIGAIRDRIISAMTERSPEVAREGEAKGSDKGPDPGDEVQTSEQKEQTGSPRGRGPRGRPRRKVGTTVPTGQEASDPAPEVQTAERGEGTLEEVRTQVPDEPPPSGGTEPAGSEGGNGGGA